MNRVVNPRFDLCSKQTKIKKGTERASTKEQKILLPSFVRPFFFFCAKDSVTLVGFRLSSGNVFYSTVVLCFVLYHPSSSQLFVKLIAMGWVDPAVIVLHHFALFKAEFLCIELDGVLVRNLDVQGYFGHVFQLGVAHVVLMCQRRMLSSWGSTGQQSCLSTGQLQ